MKTKENTSEPQEFISISGVDLLTG